MVYVRLTAGAYYLDHEQLQEFRDELDAAHSLIAPSNHDRSVADPDTQKIDASDIFVDIDNPVLFIHDGHNTAVLCFKRKKREITMKINIPALISNLRRSR